MLGQQQNRYQFGVAELNQALRLLRKYGIQPKIDRRRRQGQIWYDCFMGCGVEIALYSDAGFVQLYHHAPEYRLTLPADHEFVQLDVFRFHFQPQLCYTDREPTDWSPGMFTMVGLNGALTRWETDGEFFTTVIKE